MDVIIWHKKNSSAIILPLSMSDGYYQTLIAVYTLGALGNIMSIVVFSRKTFHGSASTLSHQMLCTLETLYMGIITWGVTIVHQKIVLTKSTCLALFYVMHVCNVICNWMVVLVTIERLTSVILPLRVRILWTKRRMLVVFFSISTITLVLYSGLFVLTTSMDTLATNSSSVFACLTHYKDANLEVAKAWLEIIFMHSMPCAILVIGNGLIIVGMGRHKAFLKRHEISPPSHGVPPTVPRDASLHSTYLTLNNNNIDASQIALSLVAKTPGINAEFQYDTNSPMKSAGGVQKEMGCFKTFESNHLDAVRLDFMQEMLIEMREQNVQSPVPTNVVTAEPPVSTIREEPVVSTVSSNQDDGSVITKDLLQFKNKYNPSKAATDTSRAPGQKQNRKMSQQSQNGQLRKERAMTITLLLINFTFLGTKAPYFIHSMTLPGFPDKSTVLTLHEAEIKLHFIILASLFNALSFILYCLAGSKFREELSKMICDMTVKVKFWC